MYAQTAEFPWCCGTTVVGNFYSSKQYYNNAIKDLWVDTGIGYFISTFNDENSNKAAYEEMKKSYDIAWESGWIPNGNMSNDTEVNLVVFKCRKIEPNNEED